MLRTKQKQIEQAADLRLQSQIGEEERFCDLMRRMARENKTAVKPFAPVSAKEKRRYYSEKKSGYYNYGGIIF